jgi:Ca-activated chloride channel family protein
LSLLHEQGRRVVVVFTDGVDSPMNFSANNSSLKDVMKRAEQEDVMVYAIGLESKYVIDGRMITTKPDSGLKKLAEETGGGYFELKRATDLAPTFTRVALELHSQYVLGFEPAQLDNKVHRLAVKLKQPGMTARARKTYLASPEKAAAPGK